MTEMSWVMGVYRDVGMMEMGSTTGSIYSGDPRVDRPHPHYHIIQRFTNSISPNI
jgi:hypothetical protein